MIVVCDTNVFVRETHLLRKKSGPELIQILRAVSGRLFVPDILRTEYLEQTLAAIDEEVNKAKGALNNLRTLTGRGAGRMREGNVGEIVADRLRELEAVTHSLSAPLEAELLAAAGRRSIEKRPPVSKSDHGFKDCVIWESVLRLPAGSEVHYISRDKKAFFTDNAFSQDLVDEAKTRQIDVAGYLSVHELVSEMQRRHQLRDLSAFDPLDAIDDENANDLSEPIARAPIPAVSTVAGRPDAHPADGTLSDIGALRGRLAEARKSFDGLEMKVLGFIAYLGSLDKKQALEVLSQASVPSDRARNIIDRLTIVGLIRDTGHHYLVPDRKVADIASAEVEGEIIALLSKGAGNG